MHTPDRSSISAETALRLSIAAELAFPDGSMTAAGLRRERNRGRLETWFTAGKEYTSLAAIEEMIRQCRAARKAPVSISSPSGETLPAPSSIAPHGSSGTAPVSIELAAALMRCEPQKRRFINT